MHSALRNKEIQTPAMMWEHLGKVTLGEPSTYTERQILCDLTHMSCLEWQIQIYGDKK